MPTPLARALRRNLLSLAIANGGAGAAMLANTPGPSPSLAFLASAAPLPVWGVAYLAVAALVGWRPLYAHTLAVPLWLMWAIGAVVGLAANTTTSRTGSIAFTGMVLSLAVMHLAGLVYRRDERESIKELGGRAASA